MALIVNSHSFILLRSFSYLFHLKHSKNNNIKFPQFLYYLYLFVTIYFSYTFSVNFMCLKNISEI